MMSDAFQWSLSLFASGSTASGIKSERMAHLFGLRPPVEEQKNIVRFIEAEVARIDRIRAPLSRSIDRLRELRSALITGAVTGQIDVATWRKGGTTEQRLDAVEADITATQPERQQARA
jgi:type I restriction enzyme, S subunit